MSYCIPERVSRKGSLPAAIHKFSLPKISRGLKEYHQKIRDKRHRRRKVKDCQPEYVAFHCLNLQILAQQDKKAKSQIKSQKPTQRHIEPPIDCRYSECAILAEKAIKLTKRSKPKTNSITKFEPRPLKEKWIPSPWEQPSNKHTFDNNAENRRLKIKVRKSKSIHSRLESLWMAESGISNMGIKSYLNQEIENIPP